MPVHYSIDASEALITTVIDDDATPEELQDYICRVMKDEDARGLDRIVLLGEVDIERFPDAAIRELADLARDLVDEKDGFRLAIVASSPVRFGLARMFELRNVRAPERQSVFHDVESARSWLGRPPRAERAVGT